jgi:Holliday junction resolvase RusA-like endonuclease
METPLIKIDLAPLSVNDAWKGKRYKTDKYKQYEKDLTWLLPKNITIPKPPLSVYYEFGITNGADGDNCIKQLQDLLAKQYKFLDNQIHEWHVKKIPVKTEKDKYIKFKISSINN